MRWFGGRAADPLQGHWTIDPADAAARARFGDVRMSFDDGRLTYEIDLPDRTQIIRLSYKIEGDELVTNQPSKPRTERTRFSVVGDRLTLIDSEGASSFLRTP